MSTRSLQSTWSALPLPVRQSNTDCSTVDTTTDAPQAGSRKAEMLTATAHTTASVRSYRCCIVAPTCGHTKKLLTNLVCFKSKQNSTNPTIFFVTISATKQPTASATRNGEARLWNTNFAVTATLSDNSADTSKSALLDTYAASASSLAVFAKTASASNKTESLALFRSSREVTPVCSS